MRKEKNKLSIKITRLGRRKGDRKIFLSIIIPIFNEEDRIYNISKVIAFFKRERTPFEIIVVDDGSFNDPQKILKDFGNTCPLTLVSYNKNQGKGFAIKEGMLVSEGEYCLFADVDLSTPLEMWNNFKPFIEKNDIVIGSRKMKGGRLIRRQPRIRELMGKMFTILSQVFLDLHVTDFTCGFKCFKREAARELFMRSKIKRWGFDSEILYIAQKRDFKVQEVPVVWHNDERSKVRFPQDVVRSLGELITIRVNDIVGRYN